MDDSFTFVHLFDQLKAGLIEGIDDQNKWFERSRNVHEDVVDNSPIAEILEVYVGKTATDWYQCTVHY